MMSPSQTIAHRFTINNLEKDLLGRGGMGEVYRATDTQTGEIVAVKALNNEILARDPSLLERFVREGEALRQLNHPNIVRMVTAVEEDERHYLVMEYVGGGSLQDLLSANEPLPHERIIQIALDLADALTRAHRLGIVHRDLKPANVLLADDGTPRLTDFGIAYIADTPHLTQTGVLVGTVDYLSPEVCQGESPDERSDIWSFGVMLFQMLTGSMPFTGESLTSKLTAILTQPIPDLTQNAPDVPDALADLVYRMLEKDRQQRIPSIRLVGAELEAVLKGRKTAAPLNPENASSPGSSIQESSERPVFVSREQELKQLEKMLDKMLSGHGQVAFIIGDPGQGKTALLQEFARREQKTHIGLVVASGNCNAYTGIGDPYLPFREIMGMLTGDVESLREAGVIGQTQANRLWHAFPFAVQHLVESGNNLIDIFVPGADLLQRATSIPVWQEREKWLSQLKQLVARKAAQAVDANLQQAALFEQFTRVVRALANHAPLILLLDDLQWADSGSINLLFHLGKRIEGKRVLVVGAYRPTEIALGRSGERHPLEPVINEFKRQFGEIQIDLSQAEGRAFVNALLDSEPNRLDDAFRQEFFRFSGGHALTTIELLRDMQERGGLIRDAEGNWIPGPTLNWDSLPVRVEATIAERMGRLDKQELAILRVAGVQGEIFSAEVISRVLGIAEPEIVSCLSSNLDREHHLVSAQGIRQIGEQRMSFYRFRHILFQKYLYNSLDPVERAHMHQQVGTTLQTLYGNETEEIAVQLALHFQKAGTTLKAADYMSQAGDRASELVAHQEAIDHYQQAMTAYKRALGDQWDPLEQAVLERKIGEAFFRKGENKQALEHLGKGLIYLGNPLPISRWGVRLATIGEIGKQISHRLLPFLFLKPISMHVSPALEEEIRLGEIIGWIEGFGNEERFLLITIKLLNKAERCGFAYAITVGFSGLAISGDMVPLFGLAGSYHNHAVTLAEEFQNPNALGLAYLGLQFHNGGLGEWATSIEYGIRAAKIYQDIIDSHSWGYVAFMTAGAMVYMGNFAAALTLALDIVRTGRERADLEVQCWGLWIQGTVQRRFGQLDQAIVTLKEAIETAQASQDYLIYQAGREELGQCYMLQGQLALALTTQDELLRYHLEHPTKSTVWLPLYNGLAEAYLLATEQSVESEKKTRLKRAGLACQNVLRHGKNYHALLPDAMRLQGTYEWLRGKPAAAKKWWQRSLAIAEKMGQRYDLGMAHLEIGRRLGDRDHLQRAETIFAEISAEWDLTRTREAIGKL
jgi:tetratricopeptide (TPR) repeat protein